jgi:hypothetical protein
MTKVFCIRRLGALKKVEDFCHRGLEGVRFGGDFGN